MKKFAVTCDFHGHPQSVVFSVGQPDSTHHPLHFQMDIISKGGGTVPPNFVESLSKLKTLSEEHKIPLDKLTYYTVNSDKEVDQNDEINAKMRDTINAASE